MGTSGFGTASPRAPRRVDRPAASSITEMFRRPPSAWASWYAIGMKICVIGTGYVGLVAGAGFADMGNDVVCCDVDAQKIEGLQRGVMPIYEPGLDKLVTHNAAEGRLTFTTNVASGVAGAEVVLLAVGTPPGPDGSADLSYIMKAAQSVG